MSYKLGLLLSIVFLMGVMFLAGDLINVSIIKNSLDSLALTVSYRISYDGMLTQDTRALIRSYQVKIRFEEGTHTSFRGFFGDGFVGEYIDPYLTATLGEPGHGNTGCLDLVAGDPAALGGYQAVLAVGDGIALVGSALHTTARLTSSLHSFRH